jgi:hypothetical protein
MRWQILIPLTSIVSSCLAFSVMWWAWQRRKEREAYYRYELSRLMLERAPDGIDRVLAWQREQEAADARDRQEGLRLAAWVLLLGGIGTLTGLGFTTKDDSLFGWVPIGTGLALFVFLALARRRQYPSP